MRSGVRNVSDRHSSSPLPVQCDLSHRLDQGLWLVRKCAGTAGNHVLRNAVSSRFVVLRQRGERVPLVRNALRGQKPQDSHMGSWLILQQALEFGLAHKADIASDSRQSSRTTLPENPLRQSSDSPHCPTIS